MRGRENYKGAQGEKICVHATQGMCKVLTRTWSAITGIYTASSKGTMPCIQTTLVQGSTTVSHGPPLLRPLDRTLLC